MVHKRKMKEPHCTVHCHFCMYHQPTVAIYTVVPVVVIVVVVVVVVVPCAQCSSIRRLVPSDPCAWFLDRSDDCFPRLPGETIFRLAIHPQIFDVTSRQKTQQ